MDLNSLTVGMSVASLVGLIGTVWFLSHRFASLELKVNTMWAFQMRRAFSEVVTSGIGTVNSPLHFTKEAIANLNPIRDELRKLCETFICKEKDDDGEILLEIERVFGNRLLTLVCIPCGLSHGSCLLLALSVAKGKSKLEINLGGDITTAAEVIAAKNGKCDL